MEAWNEREISSIENESPDDPLKILKMDGYPSKKVMIGSFQEAYFLVHVFPDWLSRHWGLWLVQKSTSTVLKSSTLFSPRWMSSKIV